jgi:transcriptional regulator with XRE-family HTH domain
MNSSVQDMVARVRELRESRSLSQEKMAEALHLPAEKYALYESGQEDIPASILYEVAQELKVDMGVLLTGEDPKMHIFTVTRHGHGVGVARVHQYAYQSLAANFIHKKAEPFLVTVPPREDGTRPVTNAHPGQEFDYVVSGTLRVYIHNQVLVLETGDSVFFDSGHDHAMEAVGDVPATFLAVIV